MTYKHGTTEMRLPSWLRRPLARPGAFAQVDGLLDELHLSTVCASAKCPNRGECYSAGTATFLVLGDACTRGCRFCAIETRHPAPPDAGEPGRIGEAVARMGLRHAVVTMVTRDDLSDGGAAHVVAVIEAIRAAAPGVAVEVLVSDFGGDEASVRAVADARPDVFNHNVETVPRLYASVRPGADYGRSLRVLALARERGGGLLTKSGLMLGLGEHEDEVRSVLRDLRAQGCAMLTLGQYLRPSARHLPVAEFVPPERFAALSREAYRMGFAAVASAPFVRSSYHAGEMAGDGPAASDAADESAAGARTADSGA